MDHESDKIFYYSVTQKDKDQRIDTFLTSQIEDLTRSRVQELIKNHFVKVSGHFPKASYRLKPGDRVSLCIPQVQSSKLQPEPVEFVVVHEDASLIVLNKPPGLVIHPAPGHPTGTLVHGLLHYCRDLSGIGGVLRPGIVHRLDKDTSGLLVVAKSDRVHNALVRQFKTGEVKKKYVALVHGVVDGNRGEVDLPIARHPKKRKEMSVLRLGGKRAITLWQKVEEIANEFSLLSVSPKTGRTHQIRVHLSHMGHPIVGDPVYGHKKTWWKKHLPSTPDISTQIERQMLHSEILGFIHPDSEKYREFRAPMPGDMARVLKTLRLVGIRNKKT